MKWWLATLCMISAVAVPAAAPAAGQAPAEDEESRARAAAELVRRAAEVTGGTGDLLAARAIGWELEGRLFWLNQGPTPGQPLELRLRQRQFADFDEGLTFVSLDYSSPESSFQRATVLRQDERSEDLLELFGMSPLAALRRLGARPADLRLIAERGSAAVVAGTLFDRLVQLEFGPDGLPRSLSYVFTDDLLGDSVRRFEYLDYRPIGGRIVPGRIRQTDAGRLVLDMSATAVAVNAAPPAWAAGLEPRPAHPPGDDGGFAVEQIAPGIHFLRRFGGSDYHGLAVELAEGWMLLETPFAIGDGAQLRRALAAIADKPIVYAIATHHHDDHAAGMAAVATPGTTVLTTPGNVAYFRSMVEAERGLTRRDGHARVMAIESGQQIGPVRFLDVGPLDHVSELLVFHFPEHRFLFQSDMGRFNEDGSVEPGRPQTCSLLTFIEENGLEVEQIYAGHGRPGTLDDLRRSVAMRERPCPQVS